MPSYERAHIDQLEKLNKNLEDIAKSIGLIRGSLYEMSGLKQKKELNKDEKDDF